MADTTRNMADGNGLEVLTRSPGAAGPESTYEKVVILPTRDDRDPAHHAWADARFAADILAEHALFFALLMPEELAAKERARSTTRPRLDRDLPTVSGDEVCFVKA